MKFIIPPLSQSESDRLAPSIVINASKSLVRWHYLCGLGCLLFGAGAAWYVMLTLQWGAALGILRGARSVLSDNAILGFAGLVALLPVINAITFFRSASAQKKFASSGLVVDLHPAMCRLRAVWRMLAISMTLVISVPIALAIIERIGT